MSEIPCPATGKDLLQHDGEVRITARFRPTWCVYSLGRVEFTLGAHAKNFPADVFPDGHPSVRSFFPKIEVDIDSPFADERVQLTLKDNDPDEEADSYYDQRLPGDARPGALDIFTTSNGGYSDREVIHEPEARRHYAFHRFFLIGGPLDGGGGGRKRLVLDFSDIQDQEHLSTVLERRLAGTFSFAREENCITPRRLSSGPFSFEHRYLMKPTYGIKDRLRSGNPYDDPYEPWEASTDVFFFLHDEMYEACYRAAKGCVDDVGDYYRDGEGSLDELEAEILEETAHESFETLVEEEFPESKEAQEYGRKLRNLL